MLEILLVSDDEPFALVMRQRLAQVGHRVTSVASMPGTFDVLSRVGTSFDLIVIAVGQPTTEDDAERYARWLGTNARVVVVPKSTSFTGATVVNLIDLVGESMPVSFGTRS